MSTDEYAARESRLLMAEITVERETARFTGRCSFCGVRCYGRACSCHTDLLLIEQAEMRAAA